MTHFADDLLGSTAGSPIWGAISSRLDFAALLDDHERLLKVSTALPALALLPEHLTLREAVNLPFELVLDCVSTSAHFELKTLLGEQMSVSLKQADGRYVPWHGYVKQAAQLGSDGGLARYRLTMGPWLDWLSLRLDSFVFQDKTALQIVEEVFADYPAAQWRVHVSPDTQAALRVRSLCTQYRETDLAFVTRLLAQEGLHYWFEHLSDEAGAQADTSGLARHVMVIADAQAQRADLGPIRFTAQHPAAYLPGLEDPITAFMAQRRLTPNAVALGSWDYAKLAGTSATTQTALDLGDVPTLQAYDGAGAYRYPDSAGAERAAALALAAAELNAKTFEGVGAARCLRAGARFSLIDHASYGANSSALSYAGAVLASHQRADNSFTVLAVTHQASNNLGSQAAQLLGQSTLERGSYKNHFECVLAAVPVVPVHRPAPTAPFALSARVVGVAGEPITAERGHRVKVQFHFQRGQHPNSGNGPTNFGAEEQGNATGDERSGTWVRVAGPAAGANWGSVYTPRIGSEVSVQFIEGDIDRPIVTGGLYTGPDAKPLAAGIDSGVNHPGVIAGLHSQRLDGQGFNQLVLDDAPGQLRARLHSSHTSAELGLGHLIQHSATSAQRGAWRGAGFEAGTQGWASVRAGAGLLISTQTRPGSYGSAQGHQMDAAEGIASLKAAHDLGQRLSQAAVAVQAQGLATHDDGQAVAKYLQAVDPTQDGKHPANVNGQSALQASDGRTPDGDPVPGFAQPVVMFDSPSALLATSPASLHTFAGQALSITAQGDLQQTAAHTYSQASGHTSSFYAHQGGITAFAANGPVSLRAHTDALSILADQSVSITSVNDEIRISANTKIELVAGQSGITLEGSDITFTTPGAFTVHGATHGFEAGASGNAPLPGLPNSAVSIPPQSAVVQHHYHDDEGVQQARYTAVLGDGQTRRGVTDSAGSVTLDNLPPGPVQIQFEPDGRAWERLDAQDNPDKISPTPTDADIDRLIDKTRGRRA
jgi:type VI secretion system secreted protein VgrG